MTDIVTIGDTKIGHGQPVFIIAEAGVNHNGDLGQAKQLVIEAKRCGADCVKFQTFKAERVVTADAPKANYQLKTTDPDESQIEMLKKLELPLDSYEELISYCRQEDILFLSTPYNVEDADFLDKLGVPAFKLPSICAAEPAFVRYVAEKGKPVILATGMATLGEVEEAVTAFEETGNNQLILLQCTTNYPSRLEDANLLAMKTMCDAFNVMVGYSDHTQDDTACILSVALGARVIEKHFTLDKDLPGPDQSTSANPVEFARLVKNIRNAEKALGSARKEPCEIQKKNALGMRRSIVARQNINKGVGVTSEMLTFKRPATGIRSLFVEEIIGKRALGDIIVNAMIRWSDLE